MTEEIQFDLFVESDECVRSNFCLSENEKPRNLKHTLLKLRRTIEILRLEYFDFHFF